MDKNDTVMYQGLFFGEELCSKAPVFLGKAIVNPHITFAFKPSKDDLFDESLIGKEVEATVVGFGCDEKACGWLLELPKDIMSLYKGAKHIHVTTSTSEIGKPVDTGNIADELWKSVEPFKVTGRLGYFKNWKVVA